MHDVKKICTRCREIHLLCDCPAEQAKDKLAEAEKRIAELEDRNAATSANAFACEADNARLREALEAAKDFFEQERLGSDDISAKPIHAFIVKALSDTGPNLYAEVVEAARPIADRLLAQSVTMEGPHFTISRSPRAGRSFNEDCVALLEALAKLDGGSDE